ncbi:hypothetical protein, partial [Enterococcus faecium]|uniref:hypothetical protein n=1 Tax=Enterococcus faecium TaxID=1352 RepID=UPI0030C7F03B
MSSRTCFFVAIIYCFGFSFLKFHWKITTTAFVREGVFGFNMEDLLINAALQSNFYKKKLSNVN